MSLTAGQQTEVEKPLIRYAYFAEFQFLSATLYVCSLSQTISWGGFDWIGLGAIGRISPVEEKQGTSASALTFELNIAQAAWLAIGVGDVTEYRGRDAKLYFCPLDESFNLVGTPVICWRGSMDTMVSSVDGTRGESTGKITLKCETSAYGLKRKANLRMNAQQHKVDYPSELGFDYLVSLMGTPTPWLSKLFQSQ